jgi:hypothetical protein
MAININIPSQFREYNNLAAFPATGSAKVLYVAKNNNKLYRWDTSAYVEVSPQLASSWGSITGNLASQVDLQGALDNKVNTESGKGLSTNDYTTTEKNKLAGIAAGAEVNVNADWNATSGDAQILNKPTIPSIAGLATTSYVDSQDATKQDVLVSGTNIKTINGTTVLGSGDITISGGSGVTDVTATSPISSTGGTTPDISITQASAADDGYLSTGDWNMFNNKQDALSSGVNIQTINYTTLLTSGNMNLVAGLSGNSPINTSILTGGIGSISIDQANSTTNGYLSSSNWNTFNGKQAALVSGTNIKTINGNSVLGSGDLAISGGGGGGIHVIAKPYTGMGVCLWVTQGNVTTTTASSQQLVFYPFIPANNVTINQIVIEVSTAVAGSTGSLTIYSDVNGRPNTRTFQSASIATSTTGYKTITTTQTFTAGTTYWIGFCVSTSGVAFRATPAANTYAISHSNGTGSMAVQNQFVYLVTTSPGSEPTTISTANLSWSFNPIVNINMRVA